MEDLPLQPRALLIARRRRGARPLPDAAAASAWPATMEERARPGAAHSQRQIGLRQSRPPTSQPPSQTRIEARVRATSIEQTDAETELTRAWVEAVNARIETRVARERLRHAVGRDVQAAR